MSSQAPSSNSRIRRNWTPVGDDVHAVEYVNVHSGFLAGVRQVPEGEDSWHVGEWEVDLPSGYFPTYFRSEEQARSFLRNWLVDHPAGGTYNIVARAERGEDEPVCKSPLDYEKNREKLSKVWEHFSPVQAGGLR